MKRATSGSEAYANIAGASTEVRALRLSRAVASSGAGTSKESLMGNVGNYQEELGSTSKLFAIRSNNSSS